MNAPRLCRSCLIAWALLAGAVTASFMWLDLPLGELLRPQALSAVADFVLAFLPPASEPEFLRKTAAASLETLAISAIGTLLAALVALPLALPASGRHGAAPRVAFRFVLNALRSVPELVWATLMVLAAGLGPFAGCLALALHTSGVLGRLFAEALENAPREPQAALELAGARPAGAFLYGTWPLVLPQLLAYSLYRWEMNIRMAAILGFVGAGGLGQMLYFELSLFHQAKAYTVILAMLALSVGVDALSGALRRRLASAA